MRHAKRLALASLLACAAPLPAAVTRIDLLGEVPLPRDLVVDGAPVGGLSGLDWDPATGDYWAISDDRSEAAPARVYRLRVDLVDGRLAPESFRVLETRFLARSSCDRFPRRSLDPEGLAFAGDRLFVSSEGEAKAGLAPFVAEAGLNGRIRRELPLPPRYLPTRSGIGVRDNLGFENLALSGDRDELLAATEGALAGDGPESDFGVASRVRVLRWDLARLAAPPAEYFYPLDPVRGAPPPDPRFRVNGLADLRPLDEETLLALEREWVEGRGYSIRIYETSLAGAEEISRLEGPALAAARPMAKRLLLDFAELGVALGNFEGMALGPTLADGRRLLLAIVDDNFHQYGEDGALLALALDTRAIAIHDVQGAAHRSPLAGSWLRGVEGVVTAVDRVAKTAGFWIESDAPDADPATSEGVFVAWARAAEIAVGDRVRVDARVAEPAFGNGLPVTTLAASGVEVLTHDAALPPPIALFVDRRAPRQVEDDALARFDPGDDALDFWESLEGMRAALGDATVVGATNSYGELFVLPDAAAAGWPRTVRGAVRRGEAPFLDRVLLSRRLVGELPQLAVGARLAGPAVGVVDYAYASYRLLPGAPLTVASPGPGCDAPPPLAHERKALRVATFNVENLSLAGPPERFTRLARVVVEALASPDLVALDEIQDDSGPAADGVVTSQGTLARLAEAIAEAGGRRYQAAWIDPELDREGGQPGGNIRVALLWDPRRLELVRRGEAGPLDATAWSGRGRRTALTLSPGRVAPTSAAFTLHGTEGVRRSLAAQFRVGRKSLFVVANHWSSKFADDRAFGAVQPPRQATGALREAQAGEIRSFALDLLGRDPEAALVVLGDLNDDEESPALRRLAAPPLVNLTWRVPEAGRYTYLFEGTAAAIDHIVVSPALARRARVGVAHVNADCPDAARTSDHDPVVAELEW